MGPPFLRVLDLPPLPGQEGDDRPLVAIAAEPWRPMQIAAGPSGDALSLRATARSPATVGVLVEALSPGVLYRWDWRNRIVVRVEGAAPASRSETAVLAGANALAVETAAGWEIVQFLGAELISQGMWRLVGLLRGQQGSEPEMRAGASAGATVVFLDDNLGRATFTSAERGAPLVWRAGPEGAAYGGAGTTELDATVRGLHDRPWSPAHLRASRVESGLALSWTARARVHGDVWHGDLAASDPLRFRVRILDGEVERRIFEVAGCDTVYIQADLAGDFPSGPGEGARIEVTQHGDRFGWGAAACVGIDG